MATTINSYSVKLGMDASGFIDSTKVSRSEARMLIKDIESARTPMEAFAVEQDRLARALKSGAIDQGTYNRLLESKRPAAMAATSALGPLSIAVGAVGAAAAAAAASGVAFIGFIRDVQNNIDDAADKAERLGLSFNEMTSLDFAFKEGGGIDAATVEASIKKLQINMAKAVDGDTELRGAFGRLGLDAGELVGMGPQRAILAIADKMQGVGTHAERLKLAMDLFGKSGGDLASTLGKGSGALQEAINFQLKWNSLTDAQTLAVGANNDAWERVSDVIGGVSSKLSAEMAPAMLLIAQHALGVADSWESVDQFIKNSVTGAVIMAGYLKDATEFAVAASTGKHTRDSVTFDSSFKFYKSLEEMRAKFVEDARESALKREQGRQNLLMQEKEAAEDKLHQKRLEAIAKEENQRAAAGLRAAEAKFQKEIERQQKMQADVAKGPGSGMEAGSADAARFMADQANQAIAESAVQVNAKPTDQQLIEEAKIQTEILRAREQHDIRMIEAVKNVGNAVKENGWEAV